MYAPSHRAFGLMVGDTVHALDDGLTHLVGQVRLLVRLVHDRDVIEDVLTSFHHLAGPVIKDYSELAREGRIVRAASGNGGRDHVAGPVLVLESLPAERRAPGRGADQKAACPLIGGRPDEIPDPL